MACIVRIELHGVSDYTALHKQMEARSFSRVVRSNDNVLRHLPTGTYISFDASTLQDAFNQADAARTAIGAHASIFVGDWTGGWIGTLTPV